MRLAEASLRTVLLAGLLRRPWLAENAGARRALLALERLEAGCSGGLHLHGRSGLLRRRCVLLT
jgi:hypothetical protein